MLSQSLYKFEFSLQIIKIHRKVSMTWGDKMCMATINTPQQPFSSTGEKQGVKYFDQW